MATLLGSLLVSLGLDSGEFRSGLSAAEKQFKAATKRFEATGKSLTDLGQKMSLAVSLPLTAFATKAVQGFQDQQQAMAQVNAALTSMGDASGKTADELSKTADALEMNSLVDADVILKQVTANLLTFGNVAGKQFDRAQQAALDMAQRMGGEPQAAAIMLGKALNDPVKGITALTRVGVQFTEAQKSQIEAMTKAGNTAGAQGIILTEVERQFKGAAKAAADTSPWRQAQVAFGQASDVIGEALLPAITAAAGVIKDMALAFTALPQSVQTGIVVLGGIAAVMGPVLAGIGAVTTAIAPLLAGLSAAFGAGGVAGLATGAIAALGSILGTIVPPLAAAAAAGYLIYQNWDKIAPVVTEFWQAIQAALGPPLRELVATVSSTLSELWNGPLGEALRSVISLIGDLVVWQAKAFGPVFIALLKGTLDIAGNVLGLIGDALKTVSRLLEGDWSAAWDSAKSMAVRAMQVINTLFAGLPAFVISVMQRMVTGISEWMGSRLNAIWQGALDKINTVKHAFFDLYDAVVGHSYVPDMVDGIAAQMLRLDSVMVDKADKATSKTKAAFQKLAEDLAPLMARLYPEATAINEYNKDKAKIQAGMASKPGSATYIDPAKGEDMLRRLAMENRPADSAIGQILADPIRLEIDKVNEALDGFKGKSETTSVAITKTFADMARDTVGALQNMANAIKGGGFLDILSSVVNLGLQLGSIGAFGKKIQTNINLPKHANGTSFAPGGLSLVGERGPELVNLPRGSRVTPNSQLGGSRVQIVPSPYFTAIVDGRVQSGLQTATPLLIGASVAETGARAARSQSRRVG